MNEPMNTKEEREQKEKKNQPYCYVVYSQTCVKRYMRVLTTFLVAILYVSALVISGQQCLVKRYAEECASTETWHDYPAWF